MSDNVQIVMALGLGMILAGALLCVGLYLGYRAGRSSRPAQGRRHHRPRSAWLRGELNACATLAQHVARHAEQLAVLASAAAPGTPHKLLAHARDLLEQSAGLSQRLDRLAHGSLAKSSRVRNSDALFRGQSDHFEKLPPASPKPVRSSAAADENRTRLSMQELGQITEWEHVADETSDELDHKKHYAYDCVQTILPWSPDDTTLPALTDGMSVRCRDISGHGISFFWPTLPQFEHLIISLGCDLDLIFMAAHVQHARPAELDGAAMYLVECRFMRRMNELTQQWAGKHQQGAQARESHAPGESLACASG